MDVTMGLLAALLWGGTDFLVGLNARAVGVKRAVYFGQALGFLIMTLLLVIFPAFLFKSLDAPLSVWAPGRRRRSADGVRRPCAVQSLCLGQSGHRRAIGDVLWGRDHLAVLGQR